MLKRIHFSVENRKEQTRFLFNGLNLPLAKTQPEKAYVKEIYTYIYTHLYIYLQIQQTVLQSVAVHASIQ